MLEIDYESFKSTDGGIITLAYTSKVGYMVRAHCLVTDRGWREFLTVYSGFPITFDSTTREDLISAGFDIPVACN